MYDSLGPLAAQGVHALAIVRQGAGRALNLAATRSIRPIRRRSRASAHLLKAPSHEAEDSCRARGPAAAAVALLLPLAAQAQNIAIVNGKPVPKARLDALLQQAARGGQQVAARDAAQARDQVVLREIFVQEAEKRGIAASADYRAQMELARQSILIRELFEDYQQEEPGHRRRRPRPSTTSSRPRPPAPNTAPATSWSRRKKTPRR